nr:hypothetical protein CFP56_55182 [Quercus suber]
MAVRQRQRASLGIKSNLGKVTTCAPERKRARDFSLIWGSSLPARQSFFRENVLDFEARESTGPPPRRCSCRTCRSVAGAAAPELHAVVQDFPGDWIALGR